MTSVVHSISSIRALVRSTPGVATLIAFTACFAIGIVDLTTAWLHIPDAAHGLLIAPVAVWLAWRTGSISAPRQATVWGGSLLMIAVALFILGRTAGVETIPRIGLILALAALTLWYGGWRQLAAWWLPFVLLALTIPLPESLIAAATLPMQGWAAKIGASMLEWRHIPVTLSGNVIRLPGHTLFVSEACSGLRSLTALVSMAILIGALFLKHPVSRVVMLGLAVALAVMVNGLRVFLTGFLVFFVDPQLGQGFMHLTEGYLLFLVSLAILGGLTWLFIRLETRLQVSGTPLAFGDR